MISSAAIVSMSRILGASAPRIPCTGPVPATLRRNRPRPERWGRRDASGWQHVFGGDYASFVRLRPDHCLSTQSTTVAWIGSPIPFCAPG
jgi:hypothetical protein